jgi:hypothetical protein
VLRPGSGSVCVLERPRRLSGCSAASTTLEHMASGVASDLYGVHETVNPFEKLNVALVQNAAGLRYQS